MRKDDVRFDHILQTQYVLGPSANRVAINWSAAHTGVSHVWVGPGHIAHARHAREIDQVDDPAAMWFDPTIWQITVSNGEVFVVLGEDDRTFAIVKVVRILDAGRGDDRNEVTLSYEIRARDKSSAQ